MSLFKDNAAAPPAQAVPEHEFYTGEPESVDALFTELEESKQQFTAPVQIPTAVVEELEASDTEEKPKTGAEQKRAARTSAKFVVGALDGGMAHLSAMIAKADESDTYKASKDEREQLTDLWAEYLKDKGTDLPPGIMILIMTVVVYGPKVQSAFSDRKQNQVVREQRERLLQQDLEIRTLRSQVEHKKLTETLNTEKP